MVSERTRIATIMNRKIMTKTPPCGKRLIVRMV